MVGVVRRRHQDVDVPPDHVALGVAEHALGGGVELLDEPASVDENDAVDRRFDDRAPAPLARAQPGFERHALVQLAQLRHVDDLVDDVGQPAVGVEDGGVGRAPVTFLEVAAFRGRTPDVVLLHRHRVGHAELAHAIERRAQIPDAGRVGVVGVVGEDVEEVAPDDLVADRHRRAQVGVARGDNRQVRREDEIEARRRVEQQPEVGVGIDAPSLSRAAFLLGAAESFADLRRPVRRITGSNAADYANRAGFAAGTVFADVAGRMGTPATRVLVVDAEPLSRWAVRESLTQAGFEVCESDGESLVDCDRTIDVLVLDATLRRCGAMEILQRVRAHSPRCCVVLLTELDDIALARLSPPTAKWRALQKPFDVADLVSAVRSLAA